MKKLYEFYFPCIVFHINRCFRGKLDGRDIAQQFFIRLFTIEINEKIKYPTAWVYKVAENIAIEVLRKNDKRKTAENRAALQDKTFDILEDGTEILKCLEEREQKIMYLRYWEDYKLKDIAIVLGMNYSTLKSAHKKAKNILKKSIKKGEKT